MSAFSRAHSRFSVKFSIPDCFNSKINKYCNDLEVAHPQSGSSSTWFLVELEFGNVGFWGEGKTRVAGEKPLPGRERTNNKFNPHMASTPEFEPGPHWWEAERSHHCAIPCSPQKDKPPPKIGKGCIGEGRDGPGWGGGWGLGLITSRCSGIEPSLRA